MSTNEVAEKKGIVYLLSNPAIPNMVKIGITTRTIEKRMAELYSTGVPLPFTCEYAINVEDVDMIESKIEQIFAKQKVNPKREFYSIGIVEAKAFFELIENLSPGKKNDIDVTEKVQKAISTNVDELSKESVEQYKKRRPNLNFEEMNIPEGKTIQFIKDREIVASIIYPNKVKYKDKEYSISGLTKELLGKDYYVGPTPYWIYENRSLNEIYEETYILE
jgi:hypothetical protein